MGNKLIKPKISIVCVTNRIGAWKYLAGQLDKQTFTNYETILADDTTDNYKARNLFNSIGDKDNWFTPRPKSENDVWNLNKAYNECMDKVSGELIVFLQDFIWIPANGLERFWEVYQLYPDDIITGVGHKARKGLEGISEVDSRAHGPSGLSPGDYTQWELNYASCPAHLNPRFNEQMDKHYGGENHYVAKKLMDSGARCWIDRSNKCIGLSQDECGGRPSDWEAKHLNKLLAKDYMEIING